MTSPDTPKKIDIGTQTEDDVQRFVEHAFSPDFVFRSPQHVKGGKHKETTDVFGLFDDVALAIQVKAQALNADGTPAAEDRDWTKRNLEKAVSQVKGAIRTIKAGQVVRLENDRRGAVQFSTDMFSYVYGLVVMNHTSDPFDARQLVPDLANVGHPVHVLSFADFYNLARVLDTPVDLIGYFEVRSQILIPTFNPQVHAEQQAFEFYVDHFEELNSFQAELHGEQRPPDLFKEHGDMLRRIYRGDSSGLEDSYFIDKIIDRAHQVDGSSPAPFENGERDYVAIATHLATLVRPRRAYIGKAFRDAVKRAGESKEDDFAQFSSQRRSDCTLFLASHRPDEERKERGQDLFRLLWLLKATRQVKRAMGIVTEAGLGRLRSYDFILLDEDPQHVTARADYEEIKRHREDLFGTTTPR
ncbi:MAG TPA: hypothetical protein VEK57_12345 [Thermoanaerobaculia bacterium]|nr:hypothetical protein [Thermoanaerobaculia bacterium]